MVVSQLPYSQWSTEKLTERILSLETQLRELNAKQHSTASPVPVTHQKKKLRRADRGREIDPSNYSTRLIALKFAYLGQKYNGYEYHANNETPLPTVEEILWRALVKARLIFPDGSSSTGDGLVNWEGCEYSKCGRTDKGVSAFGQVIAIRVRSNRPRAKPAVRPEAEGAAEVVTQLADQPAYLEGDPGDWESESLPNVEKSEELEGFDPVRDEIPYPQVLNRLLPPDIRILAWCSDLPANFSARFSCRERRYRYFFTQPAFNPTAYNNSHADSSLTSDPASNQERREGWLDLDAMKDAAKRFEGLHDFRNLCKVDPSKQLTDFRRRIFRSEICEADPASTSAAFVAGFGFSELTGNSSRTDGAPVTESPFPKVYMFTLHGSAFLWHQVRHMVAILFLIGQGLERPDLVDRLLDFNTAPQKPIYDMSDDAPLVLWDCIFPDGGSDSREDALDWIYVGGQDGQAVSRPHFTSPSRSLGRTGADGLVDGMWKLWRRAKMEEILAGTMLHVAVQRGQAPQRASVPTTGNSASQKVFQGGDGARVKGRYVPIMERDMMDSVEVINSRYKSKKRSGLNGEYVGNRSAHAGTRPAETRGDHVELPSS